MFLFIHVWCVILIKVWVWAWVGKDIKLKSALEKPHVSIKLCNIKLACWEALQQNAAFDWCQVFWQVSWLAVELVSVFSACCLWTHSVVELAQEGASGLSVLRTFRLLRILKIVRFMPALKYQLVVMLRTMDSVATFCLLLILFIFIFRSVCNRIMVVKSCVCKCSDPKSNFKSKLRHFYKRQLSIEPFVNNQPPTVDTKCHKLIIWALCQFV